MLQLTSQYLAIIARTTEEIGRLKHLARQRKRAATKKQVGSATAKVSEREFVTGNGLYSNWADVSLQDDDGFPMHSGPMQLDSLVMIGNSVRLMGIVHLDSLVANMGCGVVANKSLIPTMDQVLTAFPFVALKVKHSKSDIYICDIENMPPSAFIGDLVKSQVDTKNKKQKTDACTFANVSEAEEATN